MKEDTPNQSPTRIQFHYGGQTRDMTETVIEIYKSQLQLVSQMESIDRLMTMFVERLRTLGLMQKDGEPTEFALRMVDRLAQLLVSEGIEHLLKADRIQVTKRAGS